MSELDRRNISDQNQLNLLQASKPKEGIPIIDNSDSLKKYIKATIYEEKSLFLKECVKLNILLPSNNKKGIDFDLLLVQQERRISKQLHDTGTFKLKIQLKPHEKQDISKLNGIIEENILTKSTGCGTSKLKIDVHSRLILQLTGIKLDVTVAVD